MNSLTQRTFQVCELTLITSTGVSHDTLIFRCRHSEHDLSFAEANVSHPNFTRRREVELSGGLGNE